jgi:hypothetical protein
MKKPARTERRFVVCIRNDGYELDLALNKVYEVIPDPSAERSGWIRIVDETGEDYLYPEWFFQGAEVPNPLGDELLRAS